MLLMALTFFVLLIFFVLGWGWAMLIAAREEEYLWLIGIFLVGLLSPIYCLTKWDKAQIPFLMTAGPMAIWGIMYVGLSLSGY